MSLLIVFKLLCTCLWLCCECSSGANTAQATVGSIKSISPRDSTYFPSHLLPYLNQTDMKESTLNSHHTLAMRYGTPQGMHIKMEVLGSVVLARKPQSCELYTRQRAGDSEGEGGDCSVSVVVVFDLPVGVFVDPYELKSRHEYEWENVVVHTSAASLSHLSAEVFTRGASPFVLAVELIAVPLTANSIHADVKGIDDTPPLLTSNSWRGHFRFTLPLHLRYSSEFVPPADVETDALTHERLNPLDPARQSQCGAHRHKSPALVSRIHRPQVYVGHHLDRQVSTAAWSPGVGFATSSTLQSSSNSLDSEESISTELLDNFSTDFYIRGQGTMSEHSSAVQAMHAAHRHAKFRLSHTLGLLSQQFSFHDEYEQILADDVADFHDVLNILTAAEEWDHGDKNRSPPLLYYEDKAQASCLYLPNSEGAMEVYLHMPVPSPHHLNFVIIVTCLTIFLTTAAISVSLLIPPPTIRD